MDDSAEPAGLQRLYIAAMVLLGAGMATCGPAYAEFFLKQPGLVAAGAIVAFAAYLPSLWVIRRLDQRPFAWPAYGFAALFVIALSPVVSHVTWLLMQQGITYWKIVGIVEEIAKLLPVLLLASLAPRFVRNRRDGLVIGALAGLGFAIVEYAVSFALDNFPERGWSDLLTSLPARWALGTHAHIIWAAATGGAVGYLREAPLSFGRLATALCVILIVIFTHGAQDFLGKLIAPLSIGAVGNLLLGAGVPESAFGDGSPLQLALLVTGAVVNTVLINVLVLPILWWLLRSGNWRNRPESATAVS